MNHGSFDWRRCTRRRIRSVVKTDVHRFLYKHKEDVWANIRIERERERDNFAILTEMWLLHASAMASSLLLEQAHERDAWWNGGDNVPRSIKLLALKKLIEHETVIARVPLARLLLFYLSPHGQLCREELEKIDQSRSRSVWDQEQQETAIEQHSRL